MPYLSSKQDTTTEVAVVILRSLLRVRKLPAQIQRIGSKDPGVKGPMWISKVTIPVSAGLRDIINSTGRGPISVLGAL
jgi:hypothetical protein